MVLLLKKDKKCEKLEACIQEASQFLPPNYNFELKKTLTTVHRASATKVALQFPDGLLKYAAVIADAVAKYAGAEVVVLGDVVYGACCVDDSSSRLLGCDLLVHYGHSCLVPVSCMDVRVLYVFVDILFDVSHCCALIERNFKGRVSVLGTIQFNACVNEIRRRVGARVDQEVPLSPGEVIGCTSPVLADTDVVVYVSDGRFHLESIMINNPSLRYYKYCPFTKKMTAEGYDYEKMVGLRKESIKKFRGCKSVGVIRGMLGRQGNPAVVRNVVDRLKTEGVAVYELWLSEINEGVLDAFDFVEGFVQVSCPRLSVDWGANYRKPLLNAFEVFYDGGPYRLDYYSRRVSRVWNNF